MINFEYIKRFFIGDERFSYMHDICKNEMVVGLPNGQKFTITQEKKLFKAVYILVNSIASTKVSFIIFDKDSFKNSIETIYKLATLYDEEQSEKPKTCEEDKMAEINHILSNYNSLFDHQSKEVVPGVSATDIKLALDSYGYTFKDFTTVEGDIAILAQYGSDIKICISREKDKWIFECECKYRYLTQNKTFEADDMVEINRILSKYKGISDFNYEDAIKYPRGGNTMYKQTVTKNNDFLNDYKVVKLAEKAINDNFAELANDFIKYSNPEEDSGTILSCGNSKVLFSATRTNRKIIIEFSRDGEEPFRYNYTNNSINLLNDYDPKALITIGNLIETAVESWLEKDRTRSTIDDLNERTISAVDNIKTMIGLINSTIKKYNA